jgi:hypothetical protein
MSVSTYITFLKDRAYHARMLEAVRALALINVGKLPVELEQYFGTADPEEALNDTDELLEVASVNFNVTEMTRLPNYMREASSKNESALEIDIEKLPTSVKHIKVSRS